MKLSEETQNLIYEEGRHARTLGKMKFANPYTMGEAKSWWFAGWSDRDIELSGPSIEKRSAA